MIAIYGKSLKPENAVYFNELFRSLEAEKAAYVVEEKFAQQLQNDHTLRLNSKKRFARFDEVKTATDAVFSIGGDGTILETVTMVKDAGIPILGINFGRLGFLANTGKEQIHEAVHAVVNRNFSVEHRTLLQLDSNKPLFDEAFALNEMTIQRKDQSSMITIHTYLNGEMLNSYWADGLVVSTPTGSTGYNLSCGGPIIHPTANNFIITPVAPHNLNVRPMVVPDSVVLSFEVTGRSDAFLCTLDSRFRSIDSSFQLAVRKANFTANLIRLSDITFLSALRSKLNWGNDQRN